MDRRHFLAGAGAAAGLSVAGPATLAVANVAPAGRVNRVAVVGAGFVGASIAYNLSKRGCDVILLEKQEPAAQASGNSFSWINASYSDRPKSYFTLRTHAISEHHQLAQELNLSTRWSGALEWYHSAETEQEVAQGVQQIQTYGSATHMLDAADVADLEPELRLGGDKKVAYSPRDGAIDSAAATRALVYGVVTNGGTALYPATVRAISNNRTGVVVATDVDDFEVDLVVVAAGIAANEVAAMAGYDTPLVKPATPGIIVTTRPLQPLVNAVLYTTDTHIHQLRDGRVIIGEKDGPPGTTQHSAFLGEHPNAYPTAELGAQHAQRVLLTAQKYLPQLSDAEIGSVGVGWRPLPVDGLPIVGRPAGKPHVYLAAMHSGVTLAPVIGRLAAMEILDGVTVDLLADFRAERL